MPGFCAEFALIVEKQDPQLPTRATPAAFTSYEKNSFTDSCRTGLESHGAPADVQVSCCRPKTACSQRGLAAGPRKDLQQGPLALRERENQAKPGPGHVGASLGGERLKINICPNFSPLAACRHQTGLFQRKFRKLPPGTVAVWDSISQLATPLEWWGSSVLPCNKSADRNRPNGKAGGSQPRPADPPPGGRPTLARYAIFASWGSKVRKPEIEAHGPAPYRRRSVRAWGDRHDHRCLTICAMAERAAWDRIDCELHSPQHCSRQPSTANSAQWPASTCPLV